MLSKSVMSITINHFFYLYKYNQMSEQQNQVTEKKTVSVSQIKQDLKDGLDRKQIKKKYGLVGENATNIFNHPKLKGLKVRRQATNDVVLIDDEEGETNVGTAAPAQQETVAPQPAPEAEVTTTVVVEEEIVVTAPAAQENSGVEEVSEETSEGVW